MSDFDFGTDGAALHAGAALVHLPAIEGALSDVATGRPGVRLQGDPALATSLNAGSLHAIAAMTLGAAAKPVRAILFDKTPGTNWSLGWHQDRTIAVRERIDVAGFGPWTMKSGLLHVEPPFTVIAAMVTLRIHLDNVPADNAPLLIAPGSHRLGRIPEFAIESTAARLGTRPCLAVRGDIWAYATPVLHASAASHGHRRRRVLQVDYTATDLPSGLEWLGI